MQRSTRLFTGALAIWFTVSIAAAAVSSRAALAGLAIGAAGGVVVGVVSARRGDAHRVRVRAGRRPRRPDDDETARGAGASSAGAV